MCDWLPNPSGVRSCGTRPKVCLKPTSPQHAAGMRLDPPPSVPTPIGPEPGSHRRRGAARRPAAGPREVPRVRGAPEQRRLGEAFMAEFRGRRLADEDRAGALQPRHRRRISRRDIVGQRYRAKGGAHAGRVDQILDRERHAVQRSQRIAARHGGFGRARRCPRLLGAHRDKGVEARLALRDAGEDALHYLDRRHRTPCDERGQLGRRDKGEIVGHRWLRAGYAAV